MKRPTLSHLLPALVLALSLAPVASQAAEPGTAATAAPPAQTKTPPKKDTGDDTEGNDDSGSEPATDAAEGQTGDLVMGANGEGTHTVVKGDTLWDLSQKYLGNAWYWPKVWSYNPQIANPHWIYPGNQIKFMGAQGEESPAQVQGEPAPQEEEDDGLVGVTGKIGYVSPRTASFRQDGFVTDRELEESGQLVKSLSETEMLDDYAKIYVRFKNPGEARVGDRFFIYHTGREVTHPVTHNRVGYITSIVGTMKVTAVDPNQTYVTGLIDGAFDEIRRGDYLAPFTDKLSRLVPPKANGTDVKGYILDNLGDQQIHMGQNMIVFVDKGKRDGVEDGNVFTVIRQVDGTASISSHPGDSSFYDKSLPGEVVGKLMVVDAKDTVSTCLALSSAKELFAGDRVETFLNDSVAASDSAPAPH